ncbi:MAG: hypothetical protein P8018_02650 [Acidobacteriota bacterium]|jgi:hypothetical protein
MRRRLDVNMASEPFIHRKLLLGILVGLLGALLLASGLNVTLYRIRGKTYRMERAKLALQEKNVKALHRKIDAHKALLRSEAVANYKSEGSFVQQMLSAKKFSWTRFLAELETIKPYGTMFMDITPNVGKEGRFVSVRVRGVANPRGEVLKLEQNLFQSKVFRDVKLEMERKDSKNPWVTFQISFTYLPAGGKS